MSSRTAMQLSVLMLATINVAGCGSAGSTESAGVAQIVPGGSSPSPAPSGSPAASTPRTATVTNTGSTNTQAYTFTVSISATGVVSPASIPLTLASQLFADLAAANPVSSLPTEFCAKSASFGSSTYITYNGSTSPDLQCQSDSAAGTALDNDVSAIVQVLGVGGPKNATSP